MEAKDLQSWNAPYAIVFIVPFISTVVRFSHLLNSAAFSASTFSGMVIDFRLRHSENAEPPFAFAEGEG